MIAIPTQDELRQMRCQLIDVRSPSEFAAGHVPEAINIPLEQVESRLPDFHPQAPVWFICQSGRRAKAAAAVLRAHRSDVHVLEGGTEAWIQAGRPLVASVAARWSLERQVRLGAGSLALLGAVLAVAIHPRWVYLSGFIGAGLTFAALTDTCAMGAALARMPWNHTKRRSLGESAHLPNTLEQEAPRASV